MGDPVESINPEPLSGAIIKSMYSVSKSLRVCVVDVTMTTRTVTMPTCTIEGKEQWNALW